MPGVSATEGIPLVVADLLYGGADAIAVRALHDHPHEARGPWPRLEPARSASRAYAKALLRRTPVSSRRGPARLSSFAAQRVPEAGGG